MAPNIRSFQIAGGNVQPGQYLDFEPVAEGQVELVKSWSIAAGGTLEHTYRLYARLQGSTVVWLDELLVAATEVRHKELWHVLEAGDVLGIHAADADGTFLISGARLLA